MHFGGTFLSSVYFIIISPFSETNIEFVFVSLLYKFNAFTFTFFKACDCGRWWGIWFSLTQFLKDILFYFVEIV